MKLGSLADRAVIITDSGAVDVEAVSDGRFGPDVQRLFDDWSSFRSFADDLQVGRGGQRGAPFAEYDLGPPVPRPRQVFAIGVNYRAHATETGADLPTVPATFTKFPASINGPFSDVEVPTATTDWEVELVVVIGQRADRVAESDGWSHVAGVTVGQDVSERTLQFAAGKQYSLGKSYRGFAPIGPWLVTPGRVRRSRRPGAGLPCQRRGDAGRPHR